VTARPSLLAFSSKEGSGKERNGVDKKENKEGKGVKGLIKEIIMKEWEKKAEVKQDNKKKGDKQDESKED
jgi:hypothetical protein